jgi:hypothetical protein
MPEADDEDEEYLVINAVYNPIVADANAVEVVGASERLYSLWPGIGAECVSTAYDASLNIGRKFAELAFGGGFELDPVRHGLLQPQVFLELGERNVGTLLLERLLRGGEIEAVFDRFDHLQVFDRDECGDVPPAASQDDALARVRDAVEGVSELVAGLRGFDVGHGRTS